MKNRSASNGEHKKIDWMITLLPLALVAAAFAILRACT